MSRIAKCLDELKKRGRKALVPYIVAGDPKPQLTVAMMHRLVEAGADIIELGVPFSDPMAEGPVIQLAHERALEHGVRLSDTFAMVSEFRQRDTDTPVVLMGYANPVEAMGYAEVAERAAQAGVDGLLVVDMPPEEAQAFKQQLDKVALDMIYLIAPTTTDERIQRIAALASGYLYYVSLKGVTGSAALDTEAVKQAVARIKSYTELPICVGFGIKDEQSARAVSACAEGVVVGSALVQNAASAYACAQSEASYYQACELIAAMRRAMDGQ